MAQQIELSNGEILEFPDEMTDIQIHNAIQKEYGINKNNKEQGFFNKLPRNIGAGFLEGIRGIGNFPHALHLPNAPYFEETDFPKMLGLTGAASLSDKLIRGLAQFAPALIAPEAELGSAGEAISKIPKLGQFLKSATSQAIPQAAYGATQNENPLLGAAEGGIGGAIGSGIGGLAEKTINALRPSKLLRGNLTPKQLARNIEVTKGTETGLGNIIDNPALKRLQENILPNIIGSGAENTLQKIGNQLIDKGDAILNRLTRGESTADYGVKIQEALKKASNEANEAKNISYGKLNKLAEKHGVKIGRTNFQNTAKSIINEINESKELKQEFGKDLYNKIKGYSVNKSENNLKRTNIFKGLLGDKANELYLSGKSYESKLLGDLKNSLEKDTEEAFEKSNNPELKNQYIKTQKEYKENYAPFLDKDIIKFTRQGGDPDLILTHFLRGGKAERALLLNKLKSKMPKSQEELLSSAYFSKAVNDQGKVDPLKFRTLYNKLGKNQKNVLLGEGELRKTIKNYSDLVGKNTEAFNLLFNPKTGARNSDLLTKAGQIGSSIGAGLPGLGANIALSLGAKGANKLLTNPGIREKLVEGMIKNKKIELPKTKSGLSKIGSLEAQRQDREHKPLEIELVKKYNQTK
jgi:hypothetical protein